MDGSYIYHQAALNAENEEQLCRGLTLAIKQIIQDHYPTREEEEAESAGARIPRPPEDLCIFSDGKLLGGLVFCTMELPLPTITITLISKTD